MDYLVFFCLIVAILGLIAMGLWIYGVIDFELRKSRRRREEGKYWSDRTREARRR